MGGIVIKTDCRHFKSDVPCEYHKRQNVHCENCLYYEPVLKKILIIKLGAIGDVIRTTPLLRKLRKVYPNAEISWLTHFPETVPGTVDHVLKFKLENILLLGACRFDILYNLDKDKEACVLARLIDADIKKGFTLEDGKCVPIDEDARHKWLTGLFDDINRTNTKSYLEEIFEICGFCFNGEQYILEQPDDFSWIIAEPKPLIGLNTGCGGRWSTRLWSEENWTGLAKALRQRGYGVVLLGGAQEDEKNNRIADNSGASYLGYFSLNKFISLIDQCDLVVTAVTMALHVVIGLRKKIVLLNNIFNKNEFELYGLGKIIEPDISCKGCFKQSCDTGCMSLISVDDVCRVCDEFLGNQKGTKASLLEVKKQRMLSQTKRETRVKV